MTETLKITIETFVEEFVVITKYLLQSKESVKKGSFLLAKKDEVVEILNGNAYETADVKLRIWRALHWIDTDPNRVTRRMYKDGSAILVIKIDLRVYQTLTKILEESFLCDQGEQSSP